MTEYILHSIFNIKPANTFKSYYSFIRVVSFFLHMRVPMIYNNDMILIMIYNNVFKNDR